MARQRPVYSLRPLSLSTGDDSNEAGFFRRYPPHPPTPITYGSEALVRQLPRLPRRTAATIFPASLTSCLGMSQHGVATTPVKLRVLGLAGRVDRPEQPGHRVTVDFRLDSFQQPELCGA